MGNSSKFIEFLLAALLEALTETLATDQVGDQVKLLLNALGSGPLSALDCMGILHLSHRPTFRKNYLNPALNAGLIERTIPDKPKSQHQKYRMTQG